MVQAYVAPESTRLARPPKELKAFAKVWLEPGETKTVDLVLDARSFAYWDPGQDDWDEIRSMSPDMFNVLTPGAERRTRGWQVDAGRYDVLIGRSSQDIVARCSVDVPAEANGRIVRMRHSGHGPEVGVDGEHRKGRRAPRGGTMGIKRALSAAAALVTVLGTMLATGPAPAGAATSPADQGVTATTIQGGNPYVNFVALKSVGVNINEGSFPDAYSAIAAYMNAHGGFDGRKLVMNYAEMNPAVAADQTSSCSTLTEDDHIFVAFAPVFPACYQTTHDTLVDGWIAPRGRDRHHRA